MRVSTNGECPPAFITAGVVTIAHVERRTPFGCVFADDPMEPFRKPFEDDWEAE